YDSRVDRAITQVIHPPPRSITWLVTVVYQAGSFGVVVTLAGLALLARRWEIARDIGLSAAGTAAACGILIAVLGSHGGRPGGVVIDGYYMSFPVLLGLPSADDVRLLLGELGIRPGEVHPAARQVWGVAKFEA